MADQLFAAYPSVFVVDDDEKKIQQLIWGDHIAVLGRDGDWLQVRSRGQTGWLKEKQTQANRLLEVNFVDIGQGDGCFLVTPNDRKMIIDAGQRDNMNRFLSWRFNLRKNPDRKITIDDAVISHPDADHYFGFRDLIDNKQFKFRTIYHNGIVERVNGTDTLGPRTPAPGSMLTDIIRTQQDLETITNDPAKCGKKLYPCLLRDALAFGRVSKVRGISAADKFLPGYEKNKDVSIEVLGPVVNANNGLPWFGDVGKTKNGHSVVLKLRYGNVRMLLGGDLNIPAEEYLLEHHTGLPINGTSVETFVAKAREVFESDIAKACHHGSADFSDVYLQAVNPAATIISSGDNEPHCHPRPDALGAFGKFSRGRRPLIFSTELARSANEKITNPFAFRDEIRNRIIQMNETEDKKEKERLQKELDPLLATIERSVAVYGMITVRTDGKNVILSQKLETRRATTCEDFDVHRLEPKNGTLEYVAKH